MMPHCVKMKLMPFSRLGKAPLPIFEQFASSSWALTVLSLSQFLAGDFPIPRTLGFFLFHMFALLAISCNDPFKI